MVASYGIDLTNTIGLPASAAFDIDQQGIPTSHEAASTVEITYQAGVLASTGSEFRVLIDGVPVPAQSGVKYQGKGFTDSPTAGSTVTLRQVSPKGFTGGEVISIVSSSGSQSVLYAQKRLIDVDIGSFSVSATCPFLGIGSVEISHSGPGVQWEKLSFAVNGDHEGSRLENTSPASEMNTGDKYVREGTVAGAGCEFQRWNIIKIYYRTENRKSLIYRTKEKP